MGEDPHENICRTIAQAAGYSYNELYQRHVTDYQAFFERVSLDLGEQDPHRMTDDLLREYRAGNRSRYLETLYFQYGRYLLICSSRKGCLPPNLQGIWNCHEYAPWTGAYFHDINVQMNYWPAFNTNLIELFESYADYFKAYYNRTEEIAEEYIRRTNLDNYVKSKCGWAIGAVANPYVIGEPGSYCGPGMG